MAKKTLPDFYTQLANNGVSEGTIRRGYKPKVNAVLKLAGLDENATYAQMAAIKTAIYDKYLNNYEGNCHNHYMIVLNIFRRWLGLKKLDRKMRKAAKREPIDIDDSEVKYQKMHAACHSDRDRCIIAIMRYGGLREGEIAVLKKDNFKFADDHVMMHFYRPKTKVWGDVVMVEPVGIIYNHVTSSGEFLFEKEHGGALDVQGIYKVVRRLATRVGLTHMDGTKVVVDWHPHKFRHVRATELGKHGLTKWDLDNMMGWDPKGNTASVYVNLSNEETIKKVKKLGGIAVEEEKPIVVQHCKRCYTVLQPGEARCSRCGLSTNPVEAIKSVEEEKRQREMVEELYAAMKRGESPGADLIKRK